MNDYTHGAIVRIAAFIQLSTIEQGSRHAEEKKELMAHINVSSEPYISGTVPLLVNGTCFSILPQTSLCVWKYSGDAHVTLHSSGSWMAVETWYQRPHS